MRLHNLTILGTSHIARQSLKEVREAFEVNPPGLLALELDKQRFFGLMSKEKQKLKMSDIRHIGWKGFLFSLLGEWAERKLGEQVGVKPGSEMKLAAQLAAVKNVPVVLIDQDIAITLKKFSKTLTWREKFRFVGDIISTAIFRKKRLAFDLRTVPDQKVVESLTNEVKERYPNVYKVLIADRNLIMAKRLTALMKKDPDKQILAIVGAGHQKEILALINKYLKE